MKLSVLVILYVPRTLKVYLELLRLRGIHIPLYNLWLLLFFIFHCDYNRFLTFFARDLSYNNLTGPIPDALGALPSLLILYELFI